MGLYDFLFDNAYEQDASEAEKAIREKYPLLLHEKESLVLAFKDRGGSGRDKEYFTSHRILIKDGKGVGGKRKNYKSIPYESIQAYAVETAGKFDGDVSIKVYSSGIREAKISFAGANVDIYQIQQFLNGKVAFATAHKGDVIDATPPNMSKKQSTLGNVIDWFGDNAKQVSSEQVEETFKTTMPVLLNEEKVQVAFKSGRDYTIFTDMRVMIVDVQGFHGKKIEFCTVLWKGIHSFSVQTAGAFLDRDVEMSLFTNILDLGTIKQDFRQGKSDLFTIQKVLCNHILGEDTAPLEDLNTNQGHVDPKGFWWFRDNQRPMDCVEMNRTYHTAPTNILRGNETVEMAFKGHRDITIFSNLRVIIIDPKGLTGKQIEYISLPWKSIVAFAVRSAGKYVDFDSEVCFWTEKEFIAGKEAEGDDNPAIPAEPFMSYL